MNKKIEDAAKKYIETGRGFDMDSLSDTIKKVIFKDGAEWALREAIEICELYMNPNNKFVAEIFDVKEALEQLLSSEGEK